MVFSGKLQVFVSLIRGFPASGRREAPGFRRGPAVSPVSQQQPQPVQLSAQEMVGSQVDMVTP